MAGPRELQWLQVDLDIQPWPELLERRMFMVFGDEESLKLTYGATSYKPAVNFERNYLVAVHQGLCPTGGHGVKIHAVLLQDREIRVILSFRTPRPGEFVTLAMTTPRAFVLVPKIDSRVELRFTFYLPTGEKLAEEKPRYGQKTPERRV